MKKVLINLLNVQSGGQFTYLLNLFAECENIKNYNFVFLINRIAENRLKDKKCNIPDNVKFQVVNSKYAYGMTSYFWQFINLPKIVSNVKPNYVYAPTHIAYKVSNITTVLSMRNMAIPNFNSIDISIKMKFSLFLKYLPTLWSLSKADKVIAVSNYVKDFLISIGKDKKNILVAYHPFDNLYRKDSSDVNTCRTLNRNDNIIFVPGSYYSYKKFHNILNYLNNIKLPKDTKIVFAGDEGDNKYVNRLESYDTMNFNTIFFRNLTVDEMK